MEDFPKSHASLKPPSPCPGYVSSRSHGLSLALTQPVQVPCPGLASGSQPWPVPQLLFLSTAVLLIHMGPLPHAQRLAEVDAIEFIFCLQPQWQTFGENEERERQA